MTPIFMVHFTNVAVGFSVLSGVLSLGLLAVAVGAYRRNRDPAMAFVSGAFTLFALKSFLVAYGLWTGTIEHALLELMDATGDFGTILLILLPLFWPKRSA